MCTPEKSRITRKAYAKINLGLDVTGRRPNGYHDVKMIMQTVDLYDILTLEKTEEPGIFVETGREDLPGDKSNLVYRAAECMIRAGGITGGVRICLEKRIPMAAGMAGGSTDAAAVFHGMNELFDLGMSREELCRLGVEIGADVPYCIHGGTALAEGIGEQLTPLPAPPECILVIAKPDIDVSTKYVYENLHLESLQRHPDIDGMQEAILRGSLEGLTERMENVLESVTAVRYPVIGALKAMMCAGGAENALMSGSGPTVFGVFREQEQAAKVCEEIKKQGLAEEVFLSRWI